jgi:hypothetical protein
MGWWNVSSVSFHHGHRGLNDGGDKEETVAWGRRLKREGMLGDTIEERVGNQTTGIVWFSIGSSDERCTSPITL